MKELKLLYTAVPNQQCLCQLWISGVYCFSSVCSSANASIWFYLFTAFKLCKHGNNQLLLSQEIHVCSKQGLNDIQNQFPDNPIMIVVDLYETLFYILHLIWF
jgi:hypothetical protein